jgi:hypothetical protein
MIEHHDDDSVSFRITAFSRPATRLARIAGPLGAVVQRQITAAYLRSLAKIAVQLARMTSGQSRLLPVARSGWSAASPATICPIPKLIVQVSIPVTRSTQRLFGRAWMPTTSTRPSVPLKSSGLAV